jgi:hypothetical protein
MTLDELRACLETEGWAIVPLSETTLRGRFLAGGRVLPLLVHAGADFVTFAVIPFARVPEDRDEADPLVERLLRANREMNMAKFSIDDDGDVVLSVEYGVRDLDPSEVRDAVDVLAFYADKYAAEIDRLAAG